jgi:DNA-binding transcriptional ArsR family regulator
MESKSAPDYDLEDTMALTSSVQVRAIANRLRTTILGLLHERAASVSEIAAAVGRPKSTVAHHVNVLRDAGLLRVVRTRRIRAIDERYFGRTARMFYVGVGARTRDEALPLDLNDLDTALQESQQAYQAERLWSFIRHARIPPERAAEFWEEALALVHEFDRLPRSGSTAYGFVIGMYPITRCCPSPSASRRPHPSRQTEFRLDRRREPVPLVSWSDEPPILAARGGSSVVLRRAQRRGPRCPRYTRTTGG